MVHQDLADTRARLTVEGTEPASIHSWAADALGAGADTPSLHRTAGADLRDAEALRRHFDLALDELGAPRPDGTGARWQYVRRTAKAAVDDPLGPTDAARRIVRGAREPLGQPAGLQPFADAVRRADQPGTVPEVTEATCLRLAREYLTSRPEP